MPAAGVDAPRGIATVAPDRFGDPLGLAGAKHARDAIGEREDQIEQRRGDRDPQLEPAPEYLVGCCPHRSDSRRAPVEEYDYDMEGSGFGGLFGDPDEIQRRLGEFAEQMQGAQRLAWADNAIKLAVDLTVAAMNRINIQGTTEQQAEQLRMTMAVVFPEAVTLVREAREGLS